ncbi:uncharacterized protein LOC115792392 [Archocentrus centrarchus]|uniref:uncharacterized protein LOC115792392 n=1 Tax=Archocentrus centrarchus TaxID=63155 RepID=UPI0011E9DD29|nr:uncharacterized protein LOC115792392 [Archocentrus centrarchus]
MKVKVIFPGKVKVCFRKGPTGYLRQDPSDEAKRIKDNPDLQVKLAPQSEDSIKENARSVVFMRGGDVADRQEVLGEYVLQFGKYKGKTFRWLLENDVGYVIYLMKKVEQEELAGQFKPEGPKKDSLLSLIEYCRSFQEIEDLLKYLAERPVEAPVSNEDDNLVGFGIHANKSWRDVWDSRADGYAAFILRRRCVPGSKMYRLQQYLTHKERQDQHLTPSSLAESASRYPEMEDDEDLERMMLSISPSKLQGQLKVVEDEEMERRMMMPTDPGHLSSEVVGVQLVKGKRRPTATLSKPDQLHQGSIPASPQPVSSAPVRAPLAVPPELLSLDLTTSKIHPETASAPPTAPPAASAGCPSAPLEEKPAIPQLPTYEQDVSRWSCSHQQRIWMKTEMEALGLWPGSRPVRHLMNMISLWRYPPQPELIDAVCELPSPKYFHLHPFFIWKPEHAIMERVRNNYPLPCLYGCRTPHVVSSGVGRPRVIIGTVGQYYILASRLTCKACKKYWFADKPQWLGMLPSRFQNILPAFLTHKKAICKTVLDELRRTGKSLSLLFPNLWILLITSMCKSTEPASV